MLFLWRILSWFGSAIWPVRFRASMVQSRLRAAVEARTIGIEQNVIRPGESAVSGEGPPSRVWMILAWFLHLLLVAAVFYGLYLLNGYLRIETLLRSPFPFLHAFWMPLLFLLLYAMAWMGWLLWELTGPEKVGKDFPDLNLAWEDAVRSLADAGIDVKSAPIFLVVGRPDGAEDALFDAAPHPLRVRAPRVPNAPLRVYANEDGIFLTCVGASLLATQLRLMQEEEIRQRGAKPGADGDVHVTPNGTADQTGVEGVLTAAQAQGRRPDQLTEEERRIIGVLVAEEHAEKASKEAQGRLLLKNASERERLTRRMLHLCRLVHQERRPWCPVNGLLVVVPLDRLADDTDASDVTTACQLDLLAAREVLQVQCPTFVLLSDVHRTVGFAELIHRIPAGQRERRMGQRFPMVPDIEGSAIPGMIQDGVGWMCRARVPALVYNLLRLEPAAQPEATLGVVEGNIRLYQFMDNVQKHRQRLSRFLTRGLVQEAAGSYLFGGVYLGGAEGGENDPAFVSGVLQRLIENQSFVSWTPEALRTERAYKRWARIGCLSVLFLIAAVGAASYLFWPW